MNLSPRWCEVLDAAGHVAQHWADVGERTAPDTEIMAYAVAQGSIVLTHDLDFGSILAATGAGSPSVIQLRADHVSPEVCGPAILALLDQCRAEFVEGALATVDAARFRVTILPLTGRHG